MTKPCDESCAQCGSTDVLIQYLRKGEGVDKITVRGLTIELEGLGPGLTSYSRKVERDLLSCRCRRCQHVWTTKTLEQLKAEEREKTINGLVNEFGTKA